MQRIGYPARPPIDPRSPLVRVATAGALLAGTTLLASSSPAFAQGPCFTSGTPLPVGDSPTAVATADLDGDGQLDLVAVNQNSDTVSVLRNLGGGTFAPQVTYAVGSLPSSVAAADFDADGDVDIAVANGMSQTISVLLNQGAGTFVAGTPLATSGMPRHVTSADVSGDGRPDLVVADYSTAQVSIFPGLGLGAFGPQALYPVDVRPFWSAAADLDGDGDVDLAVANNQSRTLSILLNQGGGTFAPAASIPLSNEPSSVATGDLDGDGAIDLVVTSADFITGSQTLSVFVNHGNATFAPAVVYPTASGPHSARCADLNGDGSLDVVAASYGSTAVVRLNLGGGALGPQTQFAVGGSAFALDVGDLDGDGRIDLAVASTSIDRVVPLFDCGAAPGVLFCSGDGAGTRCPCGNNGLDGSGCANSQFGGGTSLAAVGTASIAADSVVLVTTDTPQASVLFFQGTTRQSSGAGVVFGDGKLCAGGAANRLGTKTPAAGSARYPVGADPRVSVRGHVTVPGTRTYQAWYRNAAPFCTPATFNLTNGYEIAWTP